MTGLTSPTHIALLLVVLLLVFGAKRLPEFGRSLGTGMREFKHSVSGEPAPEPSTLTSASAAEAVPQSTSQSPLQDASAVLTASVADAESARPAA